GFYLAQLAALIGIDGPQFWSVELGLLFGGEQGFHAFDADTVFLFQLLDQFVGFREKEIRIECEHSNVRTNPSSDVDQRNVLRAEARRDGRVRTELSEA